MTDLEALLKTVIDNPRDDTPRRIMADWFMDQGKDAAAKAILDLEPDHYTWGSTWFSCGMEALQGKTIKSIRTDHETSLCFETTDGELLSFDVEGDCCSNSWWHIFEGVETLIGATVLFFKEGRTDDIDENDGRGRQESESIYSIGIITDKGEARIVHRNSSNGYYGGMIRHSQGDTTGKNGKTLTEDWISPLPETANK